MNIYEKMSAITEEITAVAKNLNVGWGKNQYKAVGEADVLAAVKPIEAKHGVYSYPFGRRIIDNSVLTSVKSDGSETKQLFMRLEVIYRFVNTEKPEEYIDIVTYGDGVDPQDKAPGKAMTYADKYALLKAYKIITGDDPDQNYSNDLKSKAKKQDKQDAPAQTSSSGIEHPEKPSQTDIKALSDRCQSDNIDVDGLLKLYSVKTMQDLSYKQYINIVKHWEDVVKKFGGKK